MRERKSGVGPTDAFLRRLAGATGNPGSALERLKSIVKQQRAGIQPVEEKGSGGILPADNLR